MRTGIIQISVKMRSNVVIFFGRRGRPPLTPWEPTFIYRIEICSRSEKDGKKPPVLVRLLKSSYAEQKYDSLALVLHSVVAPNETMKNSELGGG